MSLINRQADEILAGVDFVHPDAWKEPNDGLDDCTCDELYAAMEDLPDPEEFGIDNVPVCDPCKGFGARLRR